MKRFLAWMLVCLLLIPGAALGKAKRMNADVPVWTEETVRQYTLDYIGGKDMSRLWGYYDLQIRRYMPLSAFETFMSDLQWMTGDFLELGEYTSFAEPENKLKTHVLHLYMEKKDLDLYFTHKDQEDDWEIMAIQFVPVPKQSLPNNADMLVSDDGGVGGLSSKITYTETEITVGTDETPLKGILTMPQEAAKGEKVPVCVLVHDQGAMDMDHTMGATAFFADLAHTLADMGIASIRYDKRTYTYGETPEMTAWEETVQDAILAGKQLKANPSVDTRRVVAVGLGLGASLAPRIVSQSEGAFTAMMMIGGTPESYAQYTLEHSDLSAYSAEALKALKKTVAALGDMTEAEAMALELFGKNGYYYWEMLQYDPVKLITAMRLPTYIAQGKRDPTLDEDKGWRLFSEKIGVATYVSTKGFRGLNHILMNDLSVDAEGRPQYVAATTLDHSAGRTLSQWILSLYQTEEE